MKRFPFLDIEEGISLCSFGKEDGEMLILHSDSDIHCSGFGSGSGEEAACGCLFGS